MGFGVGSRAGRTKLDLIHRPIQAPDGPLLVDGDSQQLFQVLSAPFSVALDAFQDIGAEDLRSVIGYRGLAAGGISVNLVASALPGQRESKSFQHLGHLADCDAG